MILFQFTPLREGRRNPACASALERTISIHAPPRGATLLGFHAEEGSNISIHAPPRGATLIARRYALEIYFNSRPSARGDLKQLRHARGLTQNFNSRPSARGDRPRPDNQFFFVYFNSRPSARGDAMLNM